MLLVAVAMVSASAFAGGKLTVRSDYKNSMKYTNNAGTDVAGTSLFEAHTALMDFDGKVGEATFKGQIDLKTLNSGAAGSLGYLYMTKGMGNWAFSAGLIEAAVGGYEAGRILAADSYFSSLVGANDGTAKTLGNNSGAEAAYTMGDHRLAFQVTNQGAAAGGSQTRHDMIFNYTGSLMDKMMGLNIGYAAGSKGTGATEANITNMNLGVTLALGVVDLTVDYLANNTKGLATGSKADMSNSIVLEARKSMGTWTPVFKYETSENKVSEDAANAASFKRSAMSLAGEFVPEGSQNFRYHVAYNSTTDKYGYAGAKDEAKTNILAGFKYSGDLWK